MHAACWKKADRFNNQVPYVECFNPEILWDFFISALRALQEDQERFDPSRLHVTGYSMGGQAHGA